MQPRLFGPGELNTIPAADRALVNHMAGVVGNLNEHNGHDISNQLALNYNSQQIAKFLVYLRQGENALANIRNTNNTRSWVWIPIAGIAGMAMGGPAGAVIIGGSALVGQVNEHMTERAKIALVNTEIIFQQRLIEIVSGAEKRAHDAEAKRSLLAKQSLCKFSTACSIATCVVLLLCLYYLYSQQQAPHTPNLSRFKK